jgi:Fur family transcriptional regulator, ferric uptake regulator
MPKEELKFVEFLRGSGQKVTQARRKVLEEVYRHHDHFNADDLYLRLKERKANVSRATVYRTLSLLDRCGLVRRMEGETRSLYEHVLGHPHHDHLMCLRCGRIYEFTHPSIEEMQQEVCRQFEFQMVSHTQAIYGLCRKCQSKVKA